MKAWFDSDGRLHLQADGEYEDADVKGFHDALSEGDFVIFTYAQGRLFA